MAEWALRQLPPGPGGAHTLRWMMREAEGEKLEAIAAEEGIPPERVRKRVSRLRRRMRERWRAELCALIVLFFGTTAAIRAIAPPSTLPTITAEGASSARVLGEWRLVAFTPDAPLSEPRRALVDASQPTLRIAFDGTRVTLTAAAVERTYFVLRASDESLDLQDERGNRLEVGLTWDGDVLVARLGTGPWAGSARLTR